MTIKYPQISVIVPVYKVEKYIHRCIDSILNQTFTDFELILVDDGSPDNCGAICDEYAKSDSRVVVIHKENGGVSTARNTGLDVAVGKYIAFCDSDDYWATDMLEMLSGIIEADDVDIVVSGFQRVDENGAFLNALKRSSGRECIDNEAELVSYLVHGVLSGKYGWEVCTRLFKRDIIEANTIRFCTSCGNYAEDMGFVLQYCLYIKAASSTEYCGYFYLMRSGSMMHNSVDLIKLDQVNEVSKQVGERFLKEIPACGKLYGVIHFLIMYTEYQKVIGTERYALISEEIVKIQNIYWYRNQSKGVFRCRKYLKKIYGKRHTQQILLFSHYCLHQNWKRFKIESAIAYRWLIEKE